MYLGTPDIYTKQTTHASLTANIWSQYSIAANSHKMVHKKPSF